MIPEMLARGICNTHWFWDFDLHRVVDFNGQLKSNIDALNELDEVDHHDLFAAPVGEAQHTEPTESMRPNFTHVGAKSWRRL